MTVPQIKFRCPKCGKEEMSIVYKQTDVSHTCMFCPEAPLMIQLNAKYYRKWVPLSKKWKEGVHYPPQRPVRGNTRMERVGR